MARFIEEASRTQSALFPAQLDDYVSEHNSIRVIDAFVDGLDLLGLGFDRAMPKATGRPGYRPSTMLKLYVYGYMNKIQSSRNLEREAQRNVELMWLLGRLAPDFKTIADFRKDNGPSIQAVCRQFVIICRNLDLFSKAMVAIDGSKFKGINSKQRNDTKASMKRRIERTEKNIQTYMDALDAKDKDEPHADPSEVTHLADKLASLKEHLANLKTREEEVKAHPDHQLSETDPDARLMKQSRSGSVVGYNVQNVVDVDSKLIIAHEVTNLPSDRGQLLPMAQLAKQVLGVDEFTVLTDKGYYKGADIKACDEMSVRTLIPKPKTSNNGAHGYYPREMFVYDADAGHYRCPADEILPLRHSSLEKGSKYDYYYASYLVCRACTLKNKCTVGAERRVRRWEHEAILDKVAEDLAKNPDAMTIRAKTVEHPFGTLKFYMGSTHFLMKTLPNVKTEMSLHVLAYNLRRIINLHGVATLIKMIREVWRLATGENLSLSKAIKLLYLYLVHLVLATIGPARMQLTGK